MRGNASALRRPTRRRLPDVRPSVRRRPRVRPSVRRCSPDAGRRRRGVRGSTATMDGELTAGNVVCGRHARGDQRRRRRHWSFLVPPSVPHLPKGKGQFAVNSDPSERGREIERPNDVCLAARARGRGREEPVPYLVGRGRVAAQDQANSR